MRDFNRKDNNRPDRGGSDRQELHNAICDNCSKRCKVPFEPTQGKPIYCSDCYEKLGNKGPRRDDNRRDDRRPGRDFQTDNGMFPAICADCGKDCQVPFRPSTDKPIYCSQCFENRGNGRDMDDDRRPDRDRERNFDRDDNRGRDRDMGERRPPKDPMIEELNAKFDNLKDIINTRLNVLEGINTRLTALEDLDAKIDRLAASLEGKKAVSKAKAVKVTKEVVVKEETPKVKAKKAPKERKVQAAPKY